MDVNIDYRWRFGLSILCERNGRAERKKDGATQESTEGAREHFESPF
jgi:hypothetical protein